MYFALTTLSTVGFGDLYPVRDIERLVCGFMLLGGVSMFSYITSQLESAVFSINNMEGSID